MKEVVLSTEAVNCYGFWVMTEGIDLEQFKKNPLMLYMHNRAFDNPDNIIGHWENIHIDEDARLIGTPVFSNNEFAQKCRQLFEEGNLCMASVGLDVIEMSEDPALLKQGQTYATVTKSKLREVSLVDMGANDEALALYDANNHRLQLAVGNVPACLKKIDNVKPKQNKMKEVAEKLGLSAEATAEEVLSAIGSLQEQAQELADMKSEIEKQKEAEIVLTVDEAVKAALITADKKEMFVDLAQKAGIDTLKETFALMHKPAKPTDLIHQAPAGGSEKQFKDYSMEELETLKANQPEVYAELFFNEYGVKL